MRRLQLCTLFLVLLLSGCAPAVEEEPWHLREVLGETDGDNFRRAEVVRDFQFPLDHGSHPEYRSEWWYLTCVLDGAQGEQFGVQYTLFRQALSSAPSTGNWSLDQVYLAHLAVSDVSQSRHLHDRRFARQHPANANVIADPFAATIEDWLLAEVAKYPWQLELRAAGNDEGRPFTVQLDLTQVAPVLLQGEQGLSHKGPGQASYYYSIPRLITEGTIAFSAPLSRASSGEEAVQVTGNCWLDREWSTSVLADGVEGWNWLSLSLGELDLMAFTLERTDGERDPYDHGIMRTPEETRVLSATDYTMSPLEFWQDGQGHQWPIAWHLAVQGGPNLKVVAVLDDQLMDMDLTYWEGLVAAYDEQTGELKGHGYLELTGYNGTLSTRGGGRLQ